MHITQLTAENVKKLEAVQITPDGKPVILTGDNEAGKSTVLDCIWIALRGEIPSQPIREGQTKGSITLTIEVDGDEQDITVELTFTSKGSYLSVKDADGKKKSAPQTLLDGLISSLTLDPLAFSRMKPKDQRETLLRIAGIDLTKWEENYKKLYEARTAVNRTFAEKQTAFKQCPEPPEGTPDREQSANDLIDEIEQMQAQRKAKEDAQFSLESLNETEQICRDEIARLEQELAKAKQEHAGLKKAIIAHEIPEAPTEEAIAAKREKLATIEQTNRNVREKLNRSTAEDAMKKSKQMVDRAEKAIADALAEKNKLLEKLIKKEE